MCPDDLNPESFEEKLRAIARELSQSAERMANVDVEELAESIGMDPTRARQWFDAAGGWLRGAAEGWTEDVTFSKPSPAEPDVSEDPLRRAAPHPLDLPTEEQGLALAALHSGRWTIEPGSDALAARGEGPGPSDALGLVRELHARDWISADGEVTLVGRHALSRWLDAAIPR
jgi:hypothetical protein